MAEQSASSTRPYLIRAIYEWCNDNGFTPYIAVAVDENTHVPREHVRAGEIVLNLSPSATNRLSIGNDLVTFQARFSGTVRELSIPIENVSAIYARENGHGMAFEVAKQPAQVEPTAVPQQGPQPPAEAAPTRADNKKNVTRLPAVAPTPVPASPAPAGEGGESRLATVTPLAAGTPEPPKDPEDGGGKTRGRAKLTRIK